MSLAIKFFCFLLVLGFAGLFVLKKPDGTPWLSLDGLIPDLSIGSIKDTIDDAMPEQVLGGNDSVPVYRWKDAEGNWQFSDAPPANTTTAAEQVMVSTDVNRDLAPVFTPSPVEVATPKKSGKAILIKDRSLSPTTISPDKISTLVDDAKNVQNLVDDRQKQLEDALK